jgi:hypothetical protein
MVVPVVVAMVVTPGPIFLLFFGRKFAEVSVRVAMGFIGPTIVVDNLVVVPRVVVGVIGIVYAIGVMMFGTSQSRE